MAHQANVYRKQAYGATFVSDKIEFKTKAFKKHKEGCVMLIKGTSYESCIL